MRRFISWRSEAVSLAPVHPSGWPRAIAPPFTFTLSGSSDSSRITGRDCAANASFSSTRSTRLSFIRSRFMSFGIAAIGPIPITSGATPATANPRKRAIGSTPSSFSTFPETTIATAAPSLIWEEFPAVTVPFASKAGLSFDSASIVVSARGPSSVS